MDVMIGNRENETTHFLIENKGIELMSYLFEQVGKKGKLNSDFIELLFKIIKNLINKRDNRSLIVSKLIEKIIFNIKIWGLSDYSVQVS